MTAVGGVHAVVVNWNGGAEANRACLTSLLEEGIARERLWFVDNASTDGSRELVEGEFAGVPILAQSANLGFGEGANVGARSALEAGAEAVFFVNNDLTIAPGALRLLLDALEREPRAGFVGPRVLQAEEPTRVWCAGGVLTWTENLSTLRGHGRPDGAEYRRELVVDYLPGCALLARRACLEEVGLFDAGYFAYMEDVDLGVRAAERGWKSLLVGEAVAHHASSSATGGGYNPRRKWMMGVNSVRFLRAHGGAAAWLRFLVFDVASLPLVWLANLPRGRGRAVVAKGCGILAGLRGRRVRAADLEPGGTWLW